MFLRILIAVLAIWGVTWSKDASAIYMHETCNTVLVGWNGHEAVYELRCTYQNWEWGGGEYDPDPGYGGGSGGGGDTVVQQPEPDWTKAILAQVPNSPEAHAANCQTEPSIRWQHALEDMSAHAVSKLPRFLAPGPSVIEYDDGATETWWFTGALGDTAVYPVPREGSLECAD